MSDKPASDFSDARKILLLSPDDEKARLIGKAIASETAGKILSSMSGREVTAMMLSEELQTPVSTIMYHLENLVSAGLIEVSRTRYSVKGREMKVYRLIDQVLIVSPKKFDMKEILTRCATLFSLPLALAALMISGFLQKPVPVELYDMDMYPGGALKMEANVTSYAMERMADFAPAPLAAVSPYTNTVSMVSPVLADMAAGILIGAAVVIIVGLLLDYFHR
jgi:DNA-binding transcriptional ArsR family regulator